jgi:hypothetical protein
VPARARDLRAGRTGATGPADGPDGGRPGLALPYEVYDLTVKITWLRLGALVINLLLVIYLVWSKRLFGRDIPGKAAVILAALRSVQPGQPPAVTHAYAVTVRSLVAMITVLNQQVKTLQAPRMSFSGVASCLFG